MIFPWMAIWGYNIKLGGELLPVGTLIEVKFKNAVCGSGKLVASPETFQTPETPVINAGDPILRYTPVYGKFDGGTQVPLASPDGPRAGDICRVWVNGKPTTRVFYFEEYAFFQVDDLNPMPVTVGDVNFSGDVDIEDVIVLAEYLRGVGNLPPAWAADVNQDGLVDIGDVMALADRVTFGVK